MVLQDIVNGILEGGEDGDGEDGGDDDEDPLEHIHVDERFSYLEHVIRFMAVLHSLISLFMLIAYYHLKGNSAPDILFLCTTT